MGKRGNSNIGTIALVALFAFAAGKLTGDDPKQAREATPKGFFGQARANYDATASYAEPEPFVSQDQQSALASRPFRNCREARAAGAAPVLVGEPGYAAWLDRDGDGIGCE